MSPNIIDISPFEHTNDGFLYHVYVDSIDTSYRDILHSVSNNVIIAPAAEIQITFTKCSRGSFIDQDHNISIMKSIMKIYNTNFIFY